MHYKKKQASYRSLKRQVAALNERVDMAESAVETTRSAAQREITRAVERAKHIRIPPDLLDYTLRDMAGEIARAMAVKIVKDNDKFPMPVALKACQIVSDWYYREEGFLGGDRPIEDMISAYVIEDIAERDFQVNLHIEGNLRRIVPDHLVKNATVSFGNHRQETYDRETEMARTAKVFPISGGNRPVYVRYAA